MSRMMEIYVGVGMDARHCTAKTVQANTALPVAKDAPTSMTRAMAIMSATFRTGCPRETMWVNGSASRFPTNGAAVISPSSAAEACR